MEFIGPERAQPRVSSSPWRSEQPLREAPLKQRDAVGPRLCREYVAAKPPKLARNRCADEDKENAGNASSPWSARSASTPKLRGEPTSARAYLDASLKEDTPSRQRRMPAAHEHPLADAAASSCFGGRSASAPKLRVDGFPNANALGRVAWLEARLKEEQEGRLKAQADFACATRNCSELSKQVTKVTEELRSCKEASLAQRLQASGVERHLRSEISEMSDRVSALEEELSRVKQDTNRYPVALSEREREAHIRILQTENDVLRAESGQQRRRQRELTETVDMLTEEIRTRSEDSGKLRMQLEAARGDARCELKTDVTPVSVASPCDGQFSCVAISPGSEMKTVDLQSDASTSSTPTEGCFRGEDRFHGEDRSPPGSLVLQHRVGREASSRVVTVHGRGVP